MDIKEDVKKLVEVFYQHNFKIFFVNSIDGISFVKPVGVFVSLGITTSMDVINNIKDILNGTPEYSARVVELASTKVSGQFMNRVIDRDPKQIYIEDLASAIATSRLKDGEKVLNQEMAQAELDKLKEFVFPEQDLRVLYEYSPRISKLQGLISKLNLNDGWSNNWIHEKADGEYKLYHRYINYINCGDVEYRIGILVSPK